MIRRGKRYTFGTKMGGIRVGTIHMYWLFCYKILLKTLIFIMVYIGEIGNKLTLAYSWACLGT